MALQEGRRRRCDPLLQNDESYKEIGLLGMRPRNDVDSGGNSRYMQRSWVDFHRALWSEAGRSRDTGQTKEIAEAHPQIVNAMRAAFKQFWQGERDH